MPNLGTELSLLQDQRTLDLLKGKVIRKTVASVSGEWVTFTDGTEAAMAPPVAAANDAYLVNISEDPKKHAYLVLGRPPVQFVIPMAAGNYYSNIERGFGTRVDSADYTMAANRTNFTPIFIPNTQAFDRIAVKVNVAVATSKVRLGIFTIDQSTNTMTRVLDAGEVDASTIGTKEITINITLSAGWYWLATSGLNSPVIAIFGGAATGWGMSTASLTPIASVITTGLTYGAFASTITTNTVSGSLFVVMLRAA